MLILAAVRVMSVESGNNDQLVLKVGNQQQALIDLRQPAIPISPYLFGVNVFPKVWYNFGRLCKRQLHRLYVL